MIKSFFFPIFYVVMLLLPGYLVVTGVHLGKKRFYMLPTFSISVWVLAMSMTWVVKGNATTLAVSYFSLVAGLGLFWLRNHMISGRFSLYAFSPDRLWVFIREHFVFLLLTIGYLLYATVVGPYLELPADNLWHLLVVQNKWEELSSSSVNSVFSGLGSLLLSRSYFWHYFYAFSVWVTGTSLSSSYGIVWVVNSTLLVLGVYSFAAFLFERAFRKAFPARVAALLAALFFIFHFGISAFSYLRYYSFAPAGLGLLSYFTAITFFMWVLSKQISWVKGLAVSGFLLIVATLWHTQEGLFILIMSAGLLIVAARRAFQTDWHRLHSVRLFFREYAVVFILLALAIIAYLVLHGYLYTHQTRNNPLLYGRMITVEQLLPFLKNLYILDPTNQFYQVLTIWGVAVYGAWYLGRSYFRDMDYLTTGMWLPLFTVFNPIFTDLFLRLSYPEMLWRLGFLIPLPFVAAYLSVVLFQEARQGCVGFGGGSVWRWLRWVGFMSLLVILLGPVQTRFIDSTYTKIPMLSEVNPKADYRNWLDGLQEVDKFPGAEVLTDQITGYLVNAHTRGHYRGHKFLGLNALSTRNRSYRANDLQPYAGGLLLINLRDGSDSEVGRIGKHWPEDIRKMQQWYSPEFLQLLQRCSSSFTLLWQANQMMLYRIGRTVRCSATMD